jgi:hypothetical protein
LRQAGLEVLFHQYPRQPDFSFAAAALTHKNIDRRRPLCRRKASTFSTLLSRVVPGNGDVSRD